MTARSITTDFQRLIQTFDTAVTTISSAMSILIEGRLLGQPEYATLKATRDFLEGVYPATRFHSTGKDSHIVDGLHRKQRGHNKRSEGEHPRLLQLILLHVNAAFAQAEERKLAHGHLLIPSPLHIAVEALTVPSEPHTRAYPLLAAKLLLSRRLGVAPRNAFVDQSGLNSDSLIDETTVTREIGNCRTWVEVGDIWSIKSDPKKCFVGNYLAMNGVLLIRVHEKSVVNFLKIGFFGPDWSKSGANADLRFQFRLSRRYIHLPSPADVMNEIMGIPVALRGMENVFFNGLKPSVAAGLVMQLAGGPGAGKTSFALALASALSSIGTQTFYFSFEEAESDLVSKLYQQSQPRLHRLSYHSAPYDGWFTAFSIPVDSLAVIERTLLEPLSRSIEDAKQDWPSLQAQDSILPPLPFLVVLDSLSALAITEGGSGGSRRQELAAFVDLCRRMRALVIVITSDEKKAWGELDYLVDMVISLRVEGAEEYDRKPIRLFSLVKTRHQIARHGTHIFHLSGDSGFRIAPQLSSQMDAQQNIRQLLWDRESFLEVLNVRQNSNNGHKPVSFMALHARSQILLQGRGSSGKAGLALKIAMSPRYSAQGYIQSQDVPRVIVVSFLYPPNYYEVLFKTLLKVIVKESQVTALRGFDGNTATSYVKRMALPTVVHLTPGVLYAEDLHSKLVRHLEEGRLTGRPYTAAIIDGLHNLALQFPGAAESKHLFPIMYGTLSRANVTTISTFTSLSMSTSNSTVGSDATEEAVFRLRAHLPLLHTLVQASDYVFEVMRIERDRRTEGRLWGESADGDAMYHIRVQSAISRDPPASVIGWRRQALEFCDPGAGYEDPQGALAIDQ